MRYRHVWPGFLLLAALALLLVGLVQWGDHFLSPGPTGGIHRLLQLWAASRPSEDSIAAPAASAEPSSLASEAPPTPPLVVIPPAGAPAPPEPPAPAVAPAPARTPPAPATPDPAAPAPVVEPEQPGLAGSRREEPAPARSSPSAIRYALALGTFSLSEDAERVEATLNQAGFSTVRFRRQTPAKLFAVVVSSPKDPEEGQATVERLRREGYPASVLERNGVSVRVGSPAPLRSAVQLAEKLRAGGYEARVVTDAAHAGQVNLRHGNFASRAEAEAASREVARLGVPNEVIQVR